MNSQKKVFHAKAQSRKEFSDRPTTFSPREMVGAAIPRRFFASFRLCVIFLALGATQLASQFQVYAQQPVETIRINTRVVFMDALVKDKRTGVSISDLKP